MTPAARVAAAIDLLDAIIAGMPAEKVLTGWARRARYAGSKDRAGVRDIVYDCLRNLRSYQGVSGPGGRAAAIGWCQAQGMDPASVFSGEGYAPQPLTQGEATPAPAPDAAAAADMQNWVWEMLKAQAGPEAALRHAMALKARAPCDLRVNLPRMTMAEAQGALAADGVETERITGLPAGLRTTRRPARVFATRAYLTGAVELQDAASQAVVEALPLAAGQHVLDYCAGGGGKTLAMAGRCPDARLAAWDISAPRLRQLRARATRAGVRVKVLAAPPAAAVYDIVLADVPCSGSGAWRRTPDAKWHLTPDRLAGLEAIQQKILSDAWQNLRPGGCLAYTTCSIFARENERQVDRFLQDQTAARPAGRHCWPLGTPGDGFFLNLMTKICP